jgi:hypothetical protein
MTIVSRTTIATNKLRRMTSPTPRTKVMAETNNLLRNLECASPGMEMEYRMPRDDRNTTRYR